jgi:hypothetical protein
MQEYVVDGNKNTERSKLNDLRFKNSEELEVFRQWLWCKETGDEAIDCSRITDNKEENIQRKSYQLFFDGRVSEMSGVAKVLMKMPK